MINILYALFFSFLIQDQVKRSVLNGMSTILNGKAMHRVVYKRRN